MNGYEFSPDDLKALRLLADRITDDVKWAGRRLLVEVWDEADSGAVAWIEMHPSDSGPTIRFSMESEMDQP